jgi:hypothetical protein
VFRFYRGADKHEVQDYYSENISTREPSQIVRYGMHIFTLYYIGRYRILSKATSQIQGYSKYYINVVDPELFKNF